MNTYQHRKEIARQRAIDWQMNFCNKNYSYSEIAEFYDKFSRLARRYGLIKEFKENCII